MPIIFFIAAVIALFYLSRKTINELYLFLKRIFKSNSLVYLLISIIFFPGTLLHELSHALMARMLFLQVTEIKLTPEWKGNAIRLGRVTYVKGDFIRSIIIGIAPVIGGIALFLWFAIVKIFPHDNTIINILLIYILFVISSTMFSSKQDLVDVGYLVPVGAVIGLILFLFKINIFQYLETFTQTNIWTFITVQVSAMNSMMIIVLGIHITLIIVLKLIQTIIR